MLRAVLGFLRSWCAHTCKAVGVLRDNRPMRLHEQGFQRVADNLERDVASTCEKFEDIVTKGCEAGWLDRSFEAGYLSSQGRANGSLHTPEAKVSI